MFFQDRYKGTKLTDEASVLACAAYVGQNPVRAADLLGCKTSKTQTKGKGFNQPDAPHRHWHVDVSSINICGTIYYMTSVIDGYSRSVVHQEFREQLKEQDVETILQRAQEKHPGVTPRIITDNGPPFISGDFKQFIRVSGMGPVQASPYYPPLACGVNSSNGKIERYHRTIKSECIRPGTPLALEDARSRRAQQRQAAREQTAGYHEVA